MASDLSNSLLLSTILHAWLSAERNLFTLVFKPSSGENISPLKMPHLLLGQVLKAHPSLHCLLTSAARDLKPINCANPAGQQICLVCLFFRNSISAFISVSIILTSVPFLVGCSLVRGRAWHQYNKPRKKVKVTPLIWHSRPSYIGSNWPFQLDCLTHLDCSPDNFTLSYFCAFVILTAS